MPTALPAARPVPCRAARPIDAGRRPQLHTTGLVGALNAEWARLAADDDAARREQLHRWGLEHPALADHSGLTGLVDAVTRQADDAVLRALLLLGRAGDELAARSALQAMLGAAVRLARRTVAHSGGDLEESIARAVAALWQVVREYPVERRLCRAADGVSLDVLNVLTGGRPGGREVASGLPSELGDLSDPADDDGDLDGGLRGDFWSVASPGVAPACSDEQLVLLLSWGVRRGTVSVGDARLLLRLHSPADPGAAVSCREVAEELGLTHATVRQRASRATRRLAAAVQELALGGARGAVPSAA